MMPPRYLRHLRARYRALLAHVGALCALVGLLLLVPLLAVLDAPLSPGEVLGFLCPGVVTLLGGGLTWRWLRQPTPDLTRAEGAVIVVLGWGAACLAGAIPFLLVENVGPARAVFESVSGWTTTGLSVLDVQAASPATLLWRSVMQLAGGAGLAIIMLAALTGVEGPSLAAAEGRNELLSPHVRSSTRIVLRLYSAEVLMGVGALRLAGMGWFDAVNHAFCAVSTGGFSTRAASIGHWDSGVLEAVTMGLMLLGSMNFVTLWCLARGRWRAVTRNGEVRLVGVLVPLAAAGLFFAVAAPLYGAANKGVRVALFEAVSALTTTGFSTVGYGGWPAPAILLLILLMLVGGGACSTAGGLKQYRVHLLLRAIVRELRRPFQPRGLVLDEATWEGDGHVPVTDARLRAIGTFVFLYLGTWLVGAGVLAVYGASLQDALFEFASTLGTVGLSVGLTGPHTPAVVLWAQCLGMLLGRLEFFVVIAGTVKAVRDGRQLLRWSRRPSAAVSGGARSAGA